MRKYLFFILFLCIIAAVGWILFAEKSNRTDTPNDKPLIVTSGYVPYTLTKQLAGDNANVSMLLPPGAEPHGFEPTPGALISLKNAVGFIYVSDELEPWAVDLSRTVGPHTTVLALGQALPAGKDPHVWMNLQQALQMARQIAVLLEKTFPQQQERIEQNYAQLAGELTQLDQQFKDSLANCQSREVVHIGHLAFAHLTDAYGLRLTALSGTNHDGEHSVKKLAALTKEIKDKHIRTIFAEDTLSSRLAQTVAQETNAQILPLYPIEHISKTDFTNHVTYAALMRRNLTSLVRGLQCQAF